ncbi:MerC domain-containing protein [uncultured Tenacibaculum sp.]|uniref:MerC domain-containing protein n=1 Tax=uncultured Tenacibaculum sp. TaxID=174713 RepID=UPI0026325885|nr:MerC domain-containing protein [uncultured Tenacibaculum sp.]
MKIRNNTIDIIALTSSIVCAIHCAAIPIIVSFSSLSSLHFLENPYIEWTFIAIGVIFVFMSLWPSYQKNHHKIKPLIFALIGFTFIGIGRFEFTVLWEVGNTVLGASLISMAHYFNWRISKQH